MARMDGLAPERRGLWARYLFNSVKKRVGKLSDTWPILAHSTNVLTGWALLELFGERAKGIDARLRKLAELKVAVMIGCPA